MKDFLDGMFQSPKPKAVVKEKAKVSTKPAKKTPDAMKKADKWISDVFNNFEPIHGLGSGHAELKEIRRDNQDVLASSKSHAKKEYLKKKYRNPQVDHHGEIPMIAFDPADLNKKEDDAMYLDENYSIEVPSFHIEEAADDLMDKMNKWLGDRKKDLSPWEMNDPQNWNHIHNITTQTFANTEKSADKSPSQDYRKNSV